MATSLVHNVETNEVTEIELTPEEIAKNEALAEAANAEIAIFTAKEAARISRREKLLALGLTEEELDA